ncbi:MAG: phenylacetate-CoA oxygenase subunit PaaJ [Proteobacteria bacterium]|jgi:ring-1,2-phenylacetyl-CoA epoxidase subunit PaaD|nr:phenylacetate-CoA oxygenase subunit PaaJ [Pseudomonadota bacterium]
MVTREDIFKRLENVFDPEVPVLTVLDLGIVRDVLVTASEIQVTITPTYSGCPAMNTIEADIKKELNDLGSIKVLTLLSPAWTTDWMSEEGKLKLKEYGIAPPVEGGRGMFENPQVDCVRCGSKNTKMLAQFGSTACKAMYQCQDCFEPFDYFKCHR